MKALIFILNDADLLQPLLDELKNAGVRGCTIFDTSGMGRELAYKTPDAFSMIFGAGKKSMQQSSSKTLMMVVSEEKIPSILDAIERIVGSLDEPGSGIAFTYSLDMVKGLKL
ncbi:MAG: P-II family nitrogen regulator [Firmicutes bacterium]|nr:P-II family nitrogen regulator [Bacillota bacterium]